MTSGLNPCPAALRTKNLTLKVEFKVSRNSVSVSAIKFVGEYSAHLRDRSPFSGNSLSDQ
ncbi:hypothetical protein [Motilimonas pumila]|uniref:hypothetical protein n=1 Tax=Motilimonas pumila TaxID=2303987 RepID=UPI0011C48401|nr:hypothetical protein [Motilimonas pumila]